MQFLKRHVVVDIAAIWITICANAPAQWTQFPAPGPPGTYGQSTMVFDSARTRYVLYKRGGGGQTWEFDGVTWAHRSGVGGPGFRSRSAMAYDSARGKTVLFGGTTSTGVPVNDTWEYDGVAWTQVATIGAPTPRSNHVMTYDSARGVVVLVFGGAAFGSNPETWEYDGTTWYQVNTPVTPAYRIGAGIAYDSVRGKTVVFGGYAVGGARNDTWEYDGTNWTLIPMISPPGARSYHAMVHAALHGKVVMFGGNASTNLNDTWTYDGSNWAQLPTTNPPPPRSDMMFACNQATAEMVLFGGEALSGPLGYYHSDTWKYQLSIPAAATSFGPGCGIPPLSLTTTSLPILGTTAATDITNAPTSLVFVAAGTNSQWLELSGYGMPGCYLVTQGTVAGLATTPTSSSTYQFAVAVPNTQSLMGAQLYLQAYALAPGANPTQVILSNGALWRFGH